MNEEDQAMRQAEENYRMREDEARREEVHATNTNAPTPSVREPELTRARQIDIAREIESANALQSDAYQDALEGLRRAENAPTMREALEAGAMVHNDAGDPVIPVAPAELQAPGWARIEADGVEHRTRRVTVPEVDWEEHLAEAAERVAQPTPEVTPSETKAPEKSYRVVVEQMSRRDVAVSRRPGLRDRKVIVQNVSFLPSRVYFDNEGRSNSNIEEARISRVADILNSHRDDELFCFLDEDLLKQEPPKAKFELERYVDAHTLNLMKKSPANPIVHAILMARFKHKPPATIATFEELKQWIEFNGERPANGPGAVNAPREVTNNNSDAFLVELIQDYTANGRGTYSQNRKAKSRVHISRGEMAELINDNLSLDEICDQVRDMCHEAASDGEYDDQDDGEIEWERTEEGDSTNHQGYDIQSPVSELVIRYIRDNCTEEHREELLGGE